MITCCARINSRTPGATGYFNGDINLDGAIYGKPRDEALPSPAVSTGKRNRTQPADLPERVGPIKLGHPD